MHTNFSKTIDWLIFSYLKAFKKLTFYLKSRCQKNRSRKQSSWESQSQTALSIPINKKWIQYPLSAKYYSMKTNTTDTLCMKVEKYASSDVSYVWGNDSFLIFFTKKTVVCWHD